MPRIELDASGIYDKAKAVARRAVIAPSADHRYGLSDVMDQETWLSVLSSPMICLVPVHATLDGCVEALRARGVDASSLAAVRPTPEGSVTGEDLEVARSWLAGSIAGTVDEGGRHALVGREAFAQGWVADPQQLSALVLALVLVGQGA